MKGLVYEAGVITGKTHPSHFAGTDFWIRQSLKDWTKKGKTAKSQLYAGEVPEPGQQWRKPEYQKPIYKRPLGKQSSKAAIIHKKISSTDLHKNCISWSYNQISLSGLLGRLKIHAKSMNKTVV